MLTRADLTQDMPAFFGEMTNLTMLYLNNKLTSMSALVTVLSHKLHGFSQQLVSSADTGRT